MSIWFWIATMVFILISAGMVLIILVQRPQGGGLAGAFGGAGGAGTETVFGGRVGDALTYATVTAFVLYLGLAIALNLLDTTGAAAVAGPPPAAAAEPADPLAPPPVGETATQTETARPITIPTENLPIELSPTAPDDAATDTTPGDGGGER